MRHTPPSPSRRPSRVLALVVAALGGLTAGAIAEEPYVYSHESVMGTSLEVRVWADSRAAAQGAETRVLDEIDRLSTILSGYDPNSEFSRWRRGGRARAVSAPLRDVLAAADAWRVRSAGAFDPRVEILSALWAEAAKNGREPTTDAIRKAREAMSRPAWRLDAEASVAAPLSDCPLSLNAVAKGYIVERASEAAMRHGSGVRGVAINAGGDLRAAGATEGAIGVVDPLADSESSSPRTVIEVRNRAVASSGRSQRGFSINGRWYSHILDPRTGRPVETVAGATVVAPRSADADALATICNVLPPEESLRLVDAVADAACLIVLADGRAVRSSRWATYEHPAFALAAAPAVQEPKAEADEGGAAEASGEAEKSPAEPWNPEFELAVDFEINNPSGSGTRYRRPYVAVWVEDKEGRPVRNLILWLSQGGAGPFQWVPDLKRWYRADQVRKQTDKREMIFVMSRATRPPGKYKAVWDGKTDLGKLAPQGEYTITIEAAREHGTYQSIRKDVTLAAETFTEELDGNVEIKSATVAYRRRPAPKK